MPKILVTQVNASPIFLQKGSDKDKSKTAETRVTNNPRSRPLQLNEKKNVSANTNANVGGIINNNDSGSTKTNPRNKKIGIMTAGQRNELIADNRNKVARHQRHESRFNFECTSLHHAPKKQRDTAIVTTLVLSARVSAYPLMRPLMTQLLADSQMNPPDPSVVKN